MTVLHQRPGIRNTVKRRDNSNLRARSKLRLSIVGEQDIRAATFAGAFDSRFEFVFLHATPRMVPEMCNQSDIGDSIFARQKDIWLSYLALYLGRFYLCIRAVCGSDRR